MYSNAVQAVAEESNKYKCASCTRNSPIFHIIVLQQQELYGMSLRRGSKGVQVILKPIPT